MSFQDWCYGRLSGQLPGGFPLCIEASSSHMYDSFRLVLSFLQISLDFMVFDSRYFVFALSFSSRSLKFEVSFTETINADEKYFPQLF